MTRRHARRLRGVAWALARGALLCAVAVLAVLPAASPLLPHGEARGHGAQTLPGIGQAIPWCGAPQPSSGTADRATDSHDAAACLLHCLRHAPSSGAPVLRPQAVTLPLPLARDAARPRHDAPVAPQHLLDQDPARGPPAA